MLKILHNARLNCQVKINVRYAYTLYAATRLVDIKGIKFMNKCVN